MVLCDMSSIVALLPISARNDVTHGGPIGVERQTHSVDREN